MRLSNLPVRHLDLALEHRFDVRRAFGGQLLVQVEHALHQTHHALVPRRIGGIGEVV